MKFPSRMRPKTQKVLIFSKFAFHLGKRDDVKASVLGVPLTANACRNTTTAGKQNILTASGFTGSVSTRDAGLRGGGCVCDEKLKDAGGS